MATELQKMAIAVEFHHSEDGFGIHGTMGKRMSYTIVGIPRASGAEGHVRVVTSHKFCLPHPLFVTPRTVKSGKSKKNKA